VNLGDFFQDVAQKIPGNKWASTSRLGDVLTGGLARAINRNEWRLPGYGSSQTSIDDLAAVGTGNSSRYRSIARGVGSLFGGYGLYALLGGAAGAGAAGEAGGGGVGGSVGTGALEGGGIGPAAGEGAIDASSPSWMDYLQRYGRQGANVLSTGMGQQPGQPYMPPMDNSMILPPPPKAQEDSLGSLPPGFLTMLLANAMMRQQTSASAQAPDQGPSINSGGVI